MKTKIFICLLIAFQFIRNYLDLVKMYLHTKNEVSMSRGSKVIAWTDRNTHMSLLWQLFNYIVCERLSEMQ